MSTDTSDLYPDFKAFKRDHEPFFRNLNTYLDDAKANYQTVSPWLRQRIRTVRNIHIDELHACNLRSRFNFVEKLIEIAEPAIIELPPPIRFVTIAPDIFSLPLDEAAKFDVELLQNWTKDQLGDVEFIGYVEAAFYPKWPNGRATISWHAHLLTAGVSIGALRTAFVPMNERFQSLVRGYAVGHSLLVRPDKIVAKLLYMTKHPMRQYLPYPTWNTVEADGVLKREPTGKFKQAKPCMRTGEAVKVCRVLEDQYLDRMLFGQGWGERLAQAVSNAVLATYRSRRGE